MNKSSLFEEMRGSLQSIQNTFCYGKISEDSINKYFGATLIIETLARRIFDSKSEEVKFFSDELHRTLYMTTKEQAGAQIEAAKLQETALEPDKCQKCGRLMHKFHDCNLNPHQ